MGVKYFYPKNQHLYIIVGHCKMKNPTTGEWVEAVIYQQETGGGELLQTKYVREAKDFKQKFVEIK